MNITPNINVSPNVKVNPSGNVNMNSNMNNNNHVGMMSERDMALWKVQAYEFAIIEVALFLDTHPTDQTALSYYKQYSDMKNQAVSDFTRKFGPITMDNVDSNQSTWKWIENPWPWEIGNEV